MSPESPVEYIARLEADLRRARAEITRLEDQCRSINNALSASDALRGALHQAAVEAAQVTEAALDRLMKSTARDEAVVKAAYEVCAGLTRGASSAEGERLCKVLIDAVLAHKAGAPS